MNGAGSSQGAPYSTLGMALIWRLRLGVAPCQARLSRNTADPARDAGARLLKRASYQYLLENTLQIMDAAAVSLCQNEGIPIRIYNIRVPGNIRRVVLGEDIGSTVADS